MSADQLKLHRNPPFRAEHLGSLLRPEHLLAKRVDVEKGQATEEELSNIEDIEIKEIVDMQLKLGFRAITDGEYRRHSTFSLPLPTPTFLSLVHWLTNTQQCSGAPSGLD